MFTLHVQDLKIIIKRIFYKRLAMTIQEENLLSSEVLYNKYNDLFGAYNIAN